MTRSEARRRMYNVRTAKWRMKLIKKRVSFEALVRGKENGEEPFLIYAPEIFGMVSQKARDEVVYFIGNIKNALDEGNRVHISFARTRKMFADGTLFFFANLWQIIKGANVIRRITCSYPNNIVVEQVLFKVGIFGLLGKKKRNPADHETVKFWNVATSVEVDGEQVEDVNKYYQGKLEYHGNVSPSLEQSLYTGLVEAMTNCRQHAYFEDGELLPTKKRRWWMFSQEVNGELFVAFCDLGIGIPTSLRNKQNWLMERFRTIFDERGLGNDGQLIKAAVEIGRSRTGEEHRGKGLQDIKSVLDSKGEGTLQILSGHGLYRYNPRPDEDEEGETVRNYRSPLSGTLICWGLKV